MVFETYTTYDYSFHYNYGYDVKPPPKTHNDIFYHRLEERENTIPSINMGKINRNNKGEAYYEYVYSPLLNKPSSNINTQEVKENSVLYYVKRLFCCGGVD